MELDLDELFTTYPVEACHGGPPPNSTSIHAETSLAYTVRHPFVRPEPCPICTYYFCECGVYHPPGGTLLYRCALCQMSGMNESEAQRHLEEPSDTHLAKMHEAQHARYAIRRKECRWHTIHSAPEFKRWGEDALSFPDQMLAAVFRYIMDDSTPSGPALAKVTKLLSEFEKNERLVLLRLAVWKAECVLHIGAVSVVSGNTKASSTESNWKDGKAEQRKSNSMSIIASLVLPFLA